MDQSFEIWIAQFRAGPATGEPVNAAVWASSLIDCEATLRYRAKRDGLGWTGLLKAQALTALPQPDVDALGFSPSELQLSDAKPVVFFREDASRPSTTQHSTGAIRRGTRLPFVAALDAQRGVHPALQLPEELDPHLFPDDGRKTYAILDAGYVYGLVERLEDSGLPFKCLYTGDMAEDLRDMAPYLVQLDHAAPLTRSLMTDSDSPSSCWLLEYGVFIVTLLDFDALHAHCRKFTSVRSEGGQRLYLKFWSSAVLTAFDSETGDDPLIEALLDEIEIIYRNFAHIDAVEVISLTAKGADRGPS